MKRVLDTAARTRAWPLAARLAGVSLLLLVALVARLVLAGTAPGYPYLTFYPAVLMAALLFGREVGLLAVVAATALALWYFVEPRGEFLVADPRDATAVAAFITSGVLFVVLTGAVMDGAAQRAAIAAELRSSEERLRSVLEGIGEPFYALSSDWTVIHASRAALAAWGRPAEEVVGRHLLEVFPEAAGSGPLTVLEEAMRTRQSMRVEALSPVIKRWVEVDIHPTSDGGVSVAFRDVHDRHLAQTQQQLLVTELTHRIKNTLSLVLAIADQTRRTVASPDAFQTVFRDRLSALARAHDALRRDGSVQTTLEAVAREALAPYGRADGTHIEIDGPDVVLSSGAAVALGMAFHELATNAAKYGALSKPEGRVLLTWALEEDGAAEKALHVIQWVEVGGPSIVSQPTRRGFGTRLLERGLSDYIEGGVTLEFTPTGLRCRIRLAITREVRPEDFSKPDLS